MYITCIGVGVAQYYRKSKGVPSPYCPMGSKSEQTLDTHFMQAQGLTLSTVSLVSPQIIAGQCPVCISRMLEILSKIVSQADLGVSRIRAAQDYEFHYYFLETIS